MHPQIFAARNHTAQCRLRDGARELGTLFGPSDIVPKLPAVAQKARGDKRAVQILQQQEAVGDVIAIAVRALGYLDPGALSEAAAIVAQEMLEESAVEATAASGESAAEISQPTTEGEELTEIPGAAITDYSQFDGFEDYVVVIGFTMEGVSNDPDDDRVYDEQLDAGQGLKMQPEDAQPYIDQGLIRLATPKESIPAEHVGIEVPADGTEHVLDTTGEAQITSETEPIPEGSKITLADLESQPGEVDPLIDAAQPTDAEVQAEISAEVSAITHTDNPVIEPEPAQESAKPEAAQAPEAPKKKKKK